MGASSALRRAAVGHPVGVVPGVVEVPDDRAGLGRASRRRTRTGRPCPTPSPVGEARGGTCRRSPARRRRTTPSQMPELPCGRRGCEPRIPAVEVADDRDRAGVRRPDGERGAAPSGRRPPRLGRGVVRRRSRQVVRAQRAVQGVVGPLVEQVQIERGRSRSSRARLRSWSVGSRRGRRRPKPGAAAGRCAAGPSSPPGTRRTPLDRIAPGAASWDVLSTCRAGSAARSSSQRSSRLTRTSGDSLAARVSRRAVAQRRRVASLGQSAGVAEGSASEPRPAGPGRRPRRAPRRERAGPPRHAPRRRGRRRSPRRATCRGC